MPAKPSPRFAPPKRAAVPEPTVELSDDDDDDWEPAIDLGALQEAPRPTPAPARPQAKAAEMDFTPVVGLSVSDEDDEEWSLPWGTDGDDPVAASQPASAVV